MKTNKRTKMIKNYAKMFCDTVQNECKYITTRAYPKVKCFSFQAVTSYDFGLELDDLIERHEDKEIIGGIFDKKGEAIEIYNIFREKPEELRRLVRHECLHFLLYKSGEPWDDDSNLFLLLAYYYDANPWALYPEILKKIPEGRTERR